MRRRRGVGAIANYKAALRDIKRRRAKGLPVNPDYAAQVHAAASRRPEPPARPWWADKEEADAMPNTPASYEGQPFKVTAEGIDGVRRLMAWTRLPEAEALALFRPAADRASMLGLKYEHVRNRKTGE